MCCNHGFISKMPSTTPPPFSRQTHFTPLRISLPIAGPKRGSFRAANGGEAVVMEDRSFYELLGISETVTFLEIKQAYKQLARKYHPDVSPPGRVEEYTQRFIRVQEAYETLSDPNRRALYDKDMAMGVHFGFASRNKRNEEQMKEKNEWRGQWQSQLSELKRRSMYKESGKNTSWAASMRKQRNESSSSS